MGWTGLGNLSTFNKLFFPIRPAERDSIKGKGSDYDTVSTRTTDQGPDCTDLRKLPEQSGPALVFWFKYRTEPKGSLGPFLWFLFQLNET